MSNAMLSIEESTVDPVRSWPARVGLAAIVDPYSSGVLYPDEFRRRGWACVSVIPENPPMGFQVCEEDFEAVIVHRGDVRATAAELRRRGVAEVVAGSETGVALADALASTLGLNGNDPATSALRRDKGAMQKALAEAGLAAIPTLRTDSLSDALAWARERAKPVVLKPCDSAGSDGVTICADHHELTDAWYRLHRSVNALGGSNSHLVLQERVFGTQYVVNTISIGGQHQVTDVWVDHRIHPADGRVLYDYLDLLAPQDDPRLYQQLCDYTLRALTAIGIEHGPAHSELMLVDDGGLRRPVLIETGARTEGRIVPEFMARAAGTHHVRAAVEAVVDPQAALARQPRLDQYYYRIFLRAPYDAVIDPVGWQALVSLPGVSGALGHVQGGSQVSRTVDLFTSPDMVYAVGRTRAEIDAARLAIRRLEAARTPEDEVVLYVRAA